MAEPLAPRTARLAGHRLLLWLPACWKRGGVFQPPWKEAAVTSPTLESPSGCGKGLSGAIVS